VFRTTLVVDIVVNESGMLLDTGQIIVSYRKQTSNIDRFFHIECYRRRFSVV